MYLLIFEDGAIKSTESFAAEDELSVSGGYLEIIRFHDGQYQRLDVEDDGETAPRSGWVTV